MAERFSELVTDRPPPTMNLKSNPYIDSAMPSSSVEGTWAKPKPLIHIPQPSSAFVLFRSAFLRSHQVPIPPATLLDRTNAFRLSTIASCAWKNLSEPKRKKWHKEAKEARAAHRRRFSDYAAQPRVLGDNGEGSTNEKSGGGRCTPNEGRNLRDKRYNQIRELSVSECIAPQGLLLSTSFLDHPKGTRASSSRVAKVCSTCKRFSATCLCVRPGCRTRLKPHPSERYKDNAEGPGKPSELPACRRDISKTIAVDHAPSIQSGATYNITNMYYGTVNNVRNIENATFCDYNQNGEVPPSIPPTHEHSEEAHKVPDEGLPTLVTRKTSSPPNAFVMFSSVLVRAQYSSVSLIMTDEETSEIVLEAWDSLSNEDRGNINSQAERADELHLAMLGSERMGGRGEVQREKYWTFISQITDFWLRIWDVAQGAVKTHFMTLGKDLLMASVNLTESNNSAQSKVSSLSGNAKHRGYPEPRREDKSAILAVREA